MNFFRGEKKESYKIILENLWFSDYFPSKNNEKNIKIAEMDICVEKLGEMIENFLKNCKVLLKKEKKIVISSFEYISEKLLIINHSFDFTNGQCRKLSTSANVKHFPSEKKINKEFLKLFCLSRREKLLNQIKSFTN